jgi:hypothetical protein
MFVLRAPGKVAHLGLSTGLRWQATRIGSKRGESAGLQLPVSHLWPEGRSYRPLLRRNVPHSSSARTKGECASEAFEASEIKKPK